MDAHIRVAFIGAGRMGSALIKGLLKCGTLTPSQIIASDKDKNRLEKLKEEYQVTLASSNKEAAGNADIVLLAVKPQDIPAVVQEIKDSIKEDSTMITMAAGIKTSTIESVLGRKMAVVRVMPNSAAQVRAAITVISQGKYAREEDFKRAEEIFSSVGITVLADENAQNIVTALSGSGPAYFYLLVDALAEAGIQAGLDRQTALKLAHETMFGASRMLKMTGHSPQELIDMVVSPGGTTAAALEVFNKRGFKSMVGEAVQAALKRARELEG